MGNQTQGYEYARMGRVGLSWYIDEGRDPDRRKLDNNTYAERRDGGAVAVRLHDTDVVTYNADGTVTFDTGGWFTMTTKERMNYFGPSGWVIGSDRGTWYFGHGYQDKDRVRYFDGITVNPDTGQIVNPQDAPDFDRIDAERKRLRKLIKGYVSGLTAEVARKVLTDTGGDCWFCSMRLTDGSTSEWGGPDHLIGHLEEKYYMGSLIFNAYRARGYGDPSFVLSMDYRNIDKSGIKRVRENVAKYFRKNLLANNAIQERVSA